MNKIASVILILTIASCSTGKKTPNNLNKNDLLKVEKKEKTGMKSSKLLGCWTDSYEENSDNTKIYRPCNFKSFPISRFRFKMDLKEDGSCTYLYLAPNDAHSKKAGTWTFDEETKNFKILSTGKEVIREFVIAKVEEDVLQIKK